MSGPEKTGEAPKSYEERVAACPIHKWAPHMERILQQAGLPPHAWRTFHEIVLLRGALPKDKAQITEEQFKAFGKGARDLTVKHNLDGIDARKIMQLFMDLVGQWERS